MASQIRRSVTARQWQTYTVGEAYPVTRSFSDAPSADRTTVGTRLAARASAVPNGTGRALGSRCPTPISSQWTPASSRTIRSQLTRRMPVATAFGEPAFGEPITLRKVLLRPSGDNFGTEDFWDTTDAHDGPQ